MPFATRHLYRSVLDELGQRGYDFVAGLEVEFHIFKLEDAKMSPEDAGQPGQPPTVSLLSHGYQYLTEQRYDQMEPVLEIIRRDILALDLPLRSIEVEFGPSQCEFTFAPTTGLERGRQHGAVSQRREADLPIATAITRPSCAGRNFRTCSRPDGICINRSFSRQRRERLHGERQRASR